MQRRASRAQGTEGCSRNLWCGSTCRRRPRPYITTAECTQNGLAPSTTTSAHLLGLMASVHGFGLRGGAWATARCTASVDESSRACRMCFGTAAFGIIRDFLGIPLPLHRAATRLLLGRLPARPLPPPQGKEQSDVNLFVEQTYPEGCRLYATDGGTKHEVATWCGPAEMGISIEDTVDSEEWSPFGGELTAMARLVRTVADGGAIVDSFITVAYDCTSAARLLAGCSPPTERLAWWFDHAAALERCTARGVSIRLVWVTRPRAAAALRQPDRDHR
jgi:hypothetical protein